MDNIWIGEIEGKILVYDPEIQLSQGRFIFLWDATSGRMGKYLADITRGQVKSISAQNDVSIYREKYKTWCKSMGLKWFEKENRDHWNKLMLEIKKEQEQLAQVERERLSRLTPEERHKERLEKLGLKYMGVQPANQDTKRRRITHCYDCKGHLDNAMDLECVACNWILCNCGACGCGYKSRL